MHVYVQVGRADEVEKENLKIHQLNLNLTGELEDYRHQTKTLLADLRRKEEEIATLQQQRNKLGSSDVSHYVYYMYIRTFGFYHLPKCSVYRGQSD